MEFDKFVKCKHCDSDMCYQIEVGKNTVYGCITCGFMTNIHMKEGSDLVKEQIEILPELYKEVLYVDDDNLVWLPQFYKEEGKGMVYLGGVDKENTTWFGVLDIEIPESERNNFPIPKNPGKFYKYKTDMTTLKNFGPWGFLEAINYVKGEF